MSHCSPRPDVPLLQNGGKLPVMLAMTCRDGYYTSPIPSPTAWRHWARW